MRTIAAAAFALLMVYWTSSRALAREELVVHEWGTFTSLQDETGRAIGGINDDVEPLPPFVHDLIRSASTFLKGIPVNPEVTMRLETPVVYFHLPKNSRPVKVSFSAGFHGGWLTQFYPDAATNYPPNVAVPKFESGAIGTLTWTDLTIGPGASGPATDSHVWLAPRNVKADDVTATNGESERYLFYRGVGRLDAPLKVVRAGDELQLNKEIKLHHLWYFEVRTDGSYAYRTLKPDARSTPADFTPQEYRHESLSNLRRDMKAALVESGLFDDEAEAMLETWKESYFKSPGTRLFFIVPREWTDRHLPIRLSQPAKIERVMVGRIDLVTPRHRQIIQRVMQLANEGNSPEAQQLIAELGRFGAAMIADAKSGGC